MSEFKNSVVIIDIRPEDAVKSGHIGGATAIAREKLAQMKTAFPAKKTAPVVIVAENDGAARDAFSLIRGWGYKNTSVLQGGFAGWQKAGFAVATGAAAAEIAYVPKPIAGALGINDFKSLLAKKTDDTVVIDVRTEDEAKAGTLANALNIPTEEITERLAEIPKDKKVVTFCSTGIRAEMAYVALKDKGYDVRFLNGKMDFSGKGDYTVSEN